MLKRKVDFCFKGNRNYVRGTDMFNSLIKIFDKDITNIDFMIYKITDKNIIVTNSNTDNTENLVFKFLFVKDNKKRLLYGLETDEKIKCRYDYDEKSIIDLSFINLDKKYIFSQKETKYSFIESIVAMNKYLLNNLFKIEKGKWYFTRLQLKKIPENYLPLKLVFVKSFNLKLTKTEIFIDNQSLGYIYFSLV